MTFYQFGVAVLATVAFVSGVVYYGIVWSESFTPRYCTDETELRPKGTNPQWKGP